jgi:hypothetical protein
MSVSATSENGYLYITERLTSFKMKFEPQIFKKSFLGLKISYPALRDK